jgi:hypothetical protein
MGLLAMVVAAVVLLATAAEAALPAALVLERALPLKGILLEDLRELDRARHARMNVVNFSVEGNTRPFANGWVTRCSYHNTLYIHASICI